jgi:hypothetical protein
MKITQSKLRDFLQDITLNNEDISSHFQLIINFGGNSISLEEAIDPKEEVFNCVMYAFDIYFENVYAPISKKFYADTNFLQYLINQKHLVEIDLSNVKDGDYVIYYLDTKIKHIGRVKNEKFASSKWGIGNIYKHPYEEVSSDYGDEIKFYKRIDSNLTFEMFKRYYGTCPI